MELLECRHLYKQFDNKKVLNDINLKIPRARSLRITAAAGT